MKISRPLPFASRACVSYSRLCRPRLRPCVDSHSGSRAWRQGLGRNGGSGGRARCAEQQHSTAPEVSELVMTCPTHVSQALLPPSTEILCSPVTMCCRRRGPSVTPPSIATEAPVLGSPESVRVCVSSSTFGSGAVSSQLSHPLRRRPW